MKSLSIISCSLTVLASLKGAKGWSSSPSSPLQGVATRPRQLQQQRTTVLLPLQASPKSEAPEIDLGTLKIRLTEYFEKRKQLNADVLAKENVGKIVGGTKGNKVLDFVSGSPNKAFEIENAPEPLDYDELTKYGYGDLVTPIMKAGGRLEMYRLLDMVPPAVKRRAVPQRVDLVFDRTGETDKARFKGVQMGLMDDAAQAEALLNTQRKAAKGEELRPKLEEEVYEQPFADKRNTGPKKDGYEYTVEELDRMSERQSKAARWANDARRDTLVRDPMETFDLDLTQRVYAMTTALLVVTAYGKSTPTFLTQFVGLPAGSGSEFLGVLQIPALVLLLASVGSTVVCGMQANDKRRNPVVWAFKGLMGGPLTVGQLRNSAQLVTQGEFDDQQKAAR